MTASASADRTLPFFGLLLAAGAAAIAAAGLAPQSLFPQDVANYLDVAYASAQSLRMGRDFLSPIGPGAVLPTVLAMRVGVHSAAALVAGGALAWLAYGSAAWLVARPRMPGAIAAGFALFTAATAAAPYPLDFGQWRILSYGLLYNRLAWSAVAIAACSLLPARAGEGPAAGWGAAGHGACAAWLGAIKPNYLLILAPLALVSLHDAGRRRAPAWMGCWVAGAAGTAALVWLGAPFDPFGYLREYISMGQAAPVGLLGASLERALKENGLPAIVLLIGWFIACRIRRPQASGRSAAADFGLVLLLVATGFIANVANCQFAEIPLWGALGWILAAGIVSTPQRSGGSRAAAAIGLGLGIAYAWQPLASIGYTLAWKRLPASHVQPAEQVASPAWARMPMRFDLGGPALGERSEVDGAVLSPGDFAAWLNDGLRLADRVRPPGGRILCLDWGNPFSFALGTPPIVGDLAAWSVGWHGAGPRLPAADGLLAQAAVVMEPKHSIQPAALAFKRAHFAEGLRRDFVLAGETAYWRAWARTPAPPAAVPLSGRPTAVNP